MNAVQLLVEAQKLGVEISLNGDKVRWCSEQKPPEEYLESLKAHKPELIRELSRPTEDRFLCEMNDIERRGFDLWMADAIGDGHDREMAIDRAREIWGEAQRERRANVAIGHYMDFGWVKIRSSYMGKDIYLVRDDSVSVPDASIPRYTEEEIRALKGLSQAEVMTLIETKTIFKGVIKLGEAKRTTNSGSHANRWAESN